MPRGTVCRLRVDGAWTGLALGGESGGKCGSTCRGLRTAASSQEFERPRARRPSTRRLIPRGFQIYYTIKFLFWLFFVKRASWLMTGVDYPVCGSMRSGHPEPSIESLTHRCCADVRICILFSLWRSTGSRSRQSRKWGRLIDAKSFRMLSSDYVADSLAIVGRCAEGIDCETELADTGTFPQTRRQEQEADPIAEGTKSSARAAGNTALIS